MTQPKAQKKTANLSDVPIRFRGDLAAWVAWVYYVEGETQEGVARRLGVSRATVANYLADAKARGLVEIHVSPTILAENTLSFEIRDRFGLQDVYLMPPADGRSEDEVMLRDRAGICGAQVLRAVLQPNSVLGVAWGRTMLAVGNALSREAVEGVTVLQVAGSLLNETQSSPEFCTAMIANRLQAKVLNFHAPAIVSSPELRAALMKEPSLARHATRLESCDTVIFGVGAIEEAEAFGDEMLSERQVLQAYEEAGAVAVIVGRFVDRSGCEIQGSLTDRQIGISLEALKAAQNRIFVAAGSAKLTAVRAALAGGYCTHLVIDHDIATGLLEK